MRTARPHHSPTREPLRLTALRGGQALAAAAVEDSDEWVRVMGLAAGRFDGRLDLGALTSKVALVGKTVSDLGQLLSAAPQHGSFRPQEVSLLTFSRLLLGIIGFIGIIGILGRSRTKNILSWRCCAGVQDP